MGRAILLLFCWLYLSQTVQAQTVELGGDQRIALSPYAQVLEDPLGKLGVGEVRRLDPRRFNPVRGHHANLGKNDSAWWFSITLHNPTTQPLRGFLQIDYPLLDDLRVYLDGPSGELQQYVAGDRLPFFQRPLQLRNFWFPLELPPGYSQVWLRVRSSSTLFVPMYFATEAAALVTEERNTALNGLFYGAVLAMFFYNLFLFIWIREPAYLWYLVYNVNVALFAASFDGLLFRVFPEWQPLQQGGIYALMYLHCLTALQFGRHFLRTPRYLPRADRLMQWLMLLAIAGAASGAFIDLRNWSILASVLVLVVSLVLLICGAYTWQQGRRFGAYYILAWSVLLIAFIQSTSASLGLEAVGLYGASAVKIGVVVELITLSIGLADRINLLKEEGFRSRRAAARANEENLAKSRFLAKMSHEIRTPLNGVLGTLQLLRSTDLDRSQRFYVDAIVSSGDTLMAVINDILDYARIESGRLELEDIEYDLERLLSEIMALFTAQALDKRLGLNVTMGLGVPRRVRGDPTRIKQVLINLLGNALKFTEEGHVQLRVELRGDASGMPHLLFSVRDTGIGIEPRTLSRLFESFSQGDSSTTRRYGGSGLGLVISKQLVNMMGGQIEVQSTPGQGTRFAFDLPLHFDFFDDPLEQVLGGRHALLASSDVPALDALATLLGRWGMRCAQCQTDEQLQEELQARPDPSLLILMSPWPGEPRQWLEQLQGRVQPSQRILLICPPAQHEQLPGTETWRLLGLIQPFVIVPLREALERLFLGLVPAPLPQQPQSAAAPVDAPLILVAEDNPVNRLVVQGLLRRRGYPMTTVETGRAALEAYRQAPESIGLILMDCEMPEMDGFEATRQIRRFEHEQDLPAVPVVALTAHILDEHRERGSQCGMDDFLGKPLDSDALYATLAHYLEQRRQDS